VRAFTPLAAALLAGCIAVPAFAASQGGSLAERYERARHVLEEQQAAEAKSEAEHTRLAREAEDLRNRLIANAARVQQLETQLTDTETELARLSQLAQALEIDFHRNREKVGHLLAVLQRLDADEPPAIAMRPNDSLAAVRGAMILGTMIPPIYAKTADLARSLQTLRATKSALEKKRAEAQATSDELMKARGQLAVLLDQRNLEAQSAQSQLAELHAVTEQAAKETGDLKSLIDKIAMLRAQTGVTSMTVVTAENAGAGHASAGHLRPPVAGRMLRGGPDSPNPIKGAESPGLWFLGSSSAQAVWASIDLGNCGRLRSFIGRFGPD